MRTIKLPKGVSLMNICNAMLYASADIASRKPQISSRWFAAQKDIMEANPDVDVWADGSELTEVGADCDCDGRDADEIAVYLKADELMALVHIMERVTIGDMTDEDDPVSIWKATRELQAVADRQPTNNDIILQAMGLDT